MTEALTRRLLALLDCVEGNYTCRCGRLLKVGVSSELWQVASALKRALETTEEASPEEQSRFSLLEVD